MNSSRQRLIVLRLGYRPERDKRITTHVGLTARAFGANAVWIAGPRDPQLTETIQQVCNNWGYQNFEIETGVSWRERVRRWKAQQGEIIHLTMYGLHIDNTIDSIQASTRDKLIVVGGPKVPAELFELADYNVAIGHQPHSEVAALAVFLDRFFQGEILQRIPHDARHIINPTPHGKRVQQREK